MANFLEKIALRKQEEVRVLKQKWLTAAPEPTVTAPTGLFKSALAKPGCSVIAEIKRRSPSKAFLADIENPVELAMRYVSGGAAAISVLTDQVGFNGSIEDLKNVAQWVQVPLLRKDFIIDEVQLIEARAAGAAAVLLIVAMLGQQTAPLLAKARALGLDVLVEVHTHAETEIAIAAGADIIGINNRNLSTFEVDVNTGKELVGLIPDTIIKVADSGIHDVLLAKEMAACGFDAVLIGEALVQSKAPEDFINAVGQHDY